MTEKILDLPEAVRLVLAVIEKKGADFRHQDDPNREGAENVPNDRFCVNIFISRDENDNRTFTPGCLVGSAIHEAGHPLDWFLSYGVTTGPALELINIAVSWGDVYSQSTELARLYLGSIQREQDCGRTWGRAHGRGLQVALIDSHLATATEAAWLGFRELESDNIVISNN